MTDVSGRFTGRCYCGGITLSAHESPQTVAYCHCADCRRITGAPVAAFAAFAENAVQASPAWPASKSFSPGVTRWSCPDCGSPLAAAFDYLPGQLYIALGLIDQAAELPPELHAHDGCRLPWLQVADNIPRIGGSSRSALRAAASTADPRDGTSSHNPRPIPGSGRQPE